MELGTRSAVARLAFFSESAAEIEARLQRLVKPRGYLACLLLFRINIVYCN